MRKTNITATTTPATTASLIFLTGLRIKKKGLQNGELINCESLILIYLKNIKIFLCMFQMNYYHQRLV